jgi:glycosyltransferase involved in cell wall biosynthesis
VTRSLFGDTAVIIPALNEENAICAVVSEVAYTLPGAEIIVVSGSGTSDKTGAKALMAGAQVVKQIKSGYGSAIKTGIASSSRDVLVIVDGDGTYPFVQVPALIEYHRSHKNTVVTGCRFNSKPAGMSCLRFIENMIASLFFRTLFRAKIKDTQTGLKVFPRTLAARLREEGMPFSTEIMTRGMSLGYKTKEIPLGVYRHRIGGRSKLTNLQALSVILFILRERLFFGK